MSKKAKRYCIIAIIFGVIGIAMIWTCFDDTANNNAAFIEALGNNTTYNEYGVTIFDKAVRQTEKLVLSSCTLVQNILLIFSNGFEVMANSKKYQTPIIVLLCALYEVCYIVRFRPKYKGRAPLSADADLKRWFNYYKGTIAMWACAIIMVLIVVNTKRDQIEVLGPIAEICMSIVGWVEVIYGLLHMFFLALKAATSVFGTYPMALAMLYILIGVLSGYLCYEEVIKKRK